MTETETYEVILTSEAESSAQNIRAKKDAERINAVLGVLDTVPYIGRRYVPAHNVVALRKAIRVAYAGHYGIYYRVIEDRHVVLVDFIVDQRRDPKRRFAQSAHSVAARRRNQTIPCLDPSCSCTSPARA